LLPFLRLRCKSTVYGLKVFPFLEILNYFYKKILAIFGVKPVINNSFMGIMGYMGSFK